MRQSRKLEHLKYSMLLKDGPAINGFGDFSLIHNCLPNMALDEVSLSCSVVGLKLAHPIIINAVTGGGQEVTAINERLAQFARVTNSAMAVGSQYAAFENPDVEISYKIVNKVNPNGIIFANLGAHATPEQAQQAVEMIGAKAIQIHLNVAQELMMGEGDRDFSGYRDNIAAIVKKVNVPVIVKEVGCGMAMEQAAELVQTGIKALDVGGAGGTNFLAIEAARTSVELAPEILQWGIPTAISTVEVLEKLPPHVDLIVSGGIRTPLEVVKALALGGKAVGIANPIVKLIHEHDLESAKKSFETFISQIRQFMVLLGTKTLNELATAPIIISGSSRDWLMARGINVVKYGTRQKHG